MVKASNFYSQTDCSKSQENSEKIQRSSGKLTHLFNMKNKNNFVIIQLFVTIYLALLL